MDRQRSAFDRPAVQLAAFACTLGAVVAGGALIGAAIGPEPTDEPSHEHETTETTTMNTDDALPAGLVASRCGYTLELADVEATAGREIELSFSVVGPDGRVVTDFDVEHGKELHLIVVSRDLTEYQHVHPERDDHGTWSITLPSRAAGTYRLFADFTPSGAAGLTLGIDLPVAGTFTLREPPAASDSVEVDGYTVSLDGALVAGSASTVTLSVADADGPVGDLDPYLGALGHLVAIRTGDLAYLHVHPVDEATGPGGPTIEFDVEVPTAGTYRLFLDFSHRGEVRTAAFTVRAEHVDDVNGGESGGHAPDATEGGHGNH